MNNPKFNVGDKVRIVSMECFTVVKVDNSGRFGDGTLYTIAGPDGKISACNLDETCLMKEQNKKD